MEGCASGGPICENGHLPTGDPANPAAEHAGASSGGRGAVAAGTYKTLGEALFNNDLERRRLLLRPLPHEGLVVR